MEQAQKDLEIRWTGSNPKKWWQWLLLYPTLAIGVVSALPTWVEAGTSFAFRVKHGTTREETEQNHLWQTNFACSQHAAFQNQITKWGVEIGSFVCDSGDVLLRGKRPDAPEHLRWIAWDRVAPEQKTNMNLSGVLFSAAHAAERTPPQTTVVCQRWVEPGRLLQRVQNGNACFDQRINTYTGVVLDRRPAPCAPTC